MELFNLIENKLVENNKVKLKIYALEYIIELENSEYIIYPELYLNRKSKYKFLKELFQNYTIYNENLLDNINGITIIQEA